MSDASSPDYARFDRLKDLSFHDQETYWSRFAGFATLHGGLFAIAGVALLIRPIWVAVAVSAFGLVLAGLWIVIQKRSLEYVNRWKDEFHKERKSVGLKYSGEPDGNEPNNKWSSTKWGNCVPGFVAVVWIVILSTAIYYNWLA